MVSKKGNETSYIASAINCFHYCLFLGGERLRLVLGPDPALQLQVLVDEGKHVLVDARDLPLPGEGRFQR